MGNERVHAALLEQLKNAPISKDQLKVYSSAIADIKKQGFIIDRIWRYGIPPYDTIKIRTSLDPKQLSKIQELIQSIKHRHIEIFPIGIPKPDIFEVHVEIGDQIPFRH